MAPHPIYRNRILCFIAWGALLALPLMTAAQETNLTDQPFTSVEQRRLQELIAAEREAMLNEKKALELREKELKTLEAAVDKKLAEIDDKLAALQRQQTALEKALASKDVEEQAKIQELSKIYERMDPEKAAQAMTGLDERLAAAILAHMKVKPAARILDSLNKQKAAELSKTFSTIQLE